MQAGMGEQLGEDALLKDDRDPQKCWGIRPIELFSFLAVTTLEDPVWQQVPFLTAASVLLWQRTRVLSGVPGFLRRPWSRRRVPESPPVMFATVKSKCFSNQGIRTCPRPEHSCMRRVFDFSGDVYSRSWRTLARGIRAILQADPEALEVFDPSRVTVDLHQGMKKLHTYPTCLRCGKELHGRLNACAADIDQAFEACSGARAVAAWQTALRRARTPLNPTVLVRKGARNFTKVSEAGCGRGWWRLSTAELTQAMAVATLYTLVVLGPIVLQLLGCAIGAVMSSVAVSAVLADEEANFRDCGRASRPSASPSASPSTSSCSVGATSTTSCVSLGRTAVNASRP